MCVYPLRRARGLPACLPSYPAACVLTVSIPTACPCPHALVRPPRRWLPGGGQRPVCPVSCVLQTRRPPCFCARRSRSSRKVRLFGGCGCGCTENNQPISLSSRRPASPKRARNSPVVEASHDPLAACDSGRRGSRQLLRRCAALPPRRSSEWVARVGRRRPTRTLHEMLDVAQRPRGHRRRHPSGDPPPRCCVIESTAASSCPLNRTQGPAALM